MSKIANVLPPAVLRPKEAAQYIGLSIATLARMRVDGTGPVFIQIHTRSIGYRREDLDDWVAARPRFRSTSELSS